MMIHQRHRLTPRETDIARRVSEGRTAKAIARDLGLSPRYIQTKIDEIARRLPPKVQHLSPMRAITVWWIALDFSRHAIELEEAGELPTVW
jgi:FixJ family two-component response regulator